MDLESSVSTDVQLNPAINEELATAEFRERRRVRISDVLIPACAETLYQCLVHDITWNSFLIANERLFKVRSEDDPGILSEVDAELFERAHDGARRGFAYLYDADRLFPEDVPHGAVHDDPPLPPSLARLRDLLNSVSTMSFLRNVTGIGAIARCEIQAARFRCGQFQMFHAGTYSADATGLRAAAFALNLTPEWKPEWGGLLEFRRSEGDLVDSFVPSFNTLDIYVFPQGHWISPVALFADSARLSVLGRLYAAS